jgi:hypothetical protein
MQRDIYGGWLIRRQSQRIHSPRERQTQKNKKRRYKQSESKDGVKNCFPLPVQEVAEERPAERQLGALPRADGHRDVGLVVGGQPA